MDKREVTDKKEVIDNALDELIYQIQEAAGAKNPALKRADEELLQIGGQLAQDNAVDEDTRETIQGYVDLTIRVTDEQFKYLYIQGMRDCVTFLRELGVIR